jgi:hypothetical protein
MEFPTDNLECRKTQNGYLDSRVTTQKISKNNLSAHENIMSYQSRNRVRSMNDSISFKESGLGTETQYIQEPSANSPPVGP